MTYDELKQAQAAGARIQAYTLLGDDGSAAIEEVYGRGRAYWRTLDEPAHWLCHPTRYRVHPDDLHKVELGAENVIAHDRAALKLIGMGYAYNGTEWAHPLLPFDSGLVRDAITEEAIVALVAGPYMYHHKMDDHAMREGKAFDRCRELTIQNIRTFFATRKAFDAAIHAQEGGSES